MKIDQLLISNFRGISRVEANDLGDTIIIAGQNGSGKTCLFDAIRLLKSVYGGYQQNEWQHFFGEFAIQLHGGAKNLTGLFNDAKNPVIIETYFRLRDNEKRYISENARSLLEEAIWRTLLPEAFQYSYQSALFANQFRERQPEVTARVQAQLPTLQQQLAQEQIIGRVQIDPDSTITISESLLLSVVFTNYRPTQIGVIDFHGAQRHYGRENVQGINLNLDQANQQRGQHTLYNYAAKYANVKSEMAGSYVKELLAEKAGPTKVAEPRPLSATLKELFESFFPEKKFMGPRPTQDGRLSFPVVTPAGTEHDLDELSSGEKEILYGYLRIRSSAPRDSIILLDEPELHLNPRLIRGLPEFYRKHLGEALHNQLWLVTHSDALIREAVGKPGFNVFHMLPCGSEVEGTSQIKPLRASHDLDMVLADLIGDLAAYRPGGKGLIFEGGGDTDFDKTLAGALFADELRGINLISGTNKARVRALHEILSRAYEKGDLPTKFYAVVDRDSDDTAEVSKAVYRYEWGVYHIENYLLNGGIIADALNSLQLGSKYDEDGIWSKLNSAARNVIPGMLAHKMRRYVNAKMIGSIDLGFDPSIVTIGKELHKAANRSFQRMETTFSGDLSEDALVAREQHFRNEIEESFADGTWSTELPGREILKQFVSLEKLPLGYEVFRNLIASRMAEAGVKPPGMKNIIDRIRED